MDGDGQQTLEEKLRGWVERSGFALELRVARAFKRAKATEIIPSHSYYDNEWSTWREIDVVAGFEKRGDAGRRLLVVVECKNPRRSRPWVVFTDERGYITDDESFQRLLRTTSKVELARKSWTSARGTAALPTNAPGFSIAEALREQDGEDEGPNVPYRATQQVVNAAHNLQSHFPNRLQQDAVQFVVPIVVTTAPLFECRLGDDAEVVVQRVEDSSLWVQPDRPVDQSRGPWRTTPRPMMVQVMSERHLVTEWAPAAAETANLM